MAKGFEIFIDLPINLKALGDRFQKRLADWVQKQIAKGRTKEDILRELRDSEKQDGEGIIKTILSQTEGDVSLNTLPAGSELVTWTLSPESEQMQFPNGIEFCDPEEVPEWPVHPDTSDWWKHLKDGHCSSCLHQATLGPRDIATIPIPGTQPTVGETNCGRYCCCELIPLIPLDIK